MLLLYISIRLCAQISKNCLLLDASITCQHIQSSLVCFHSPTAWARGSWMQCCSAISVTCCLINWTGNKHLKCRKSFSPTSQIFPHQITKSSGSGAQLSWLTHSKMALTCILGRKNVFCCSLLFFNKRQILKRKV